MIRHNKKVISWYSMIYDGVVKSRRTMIVFSFLSFLVLRCSEVEIGRCQHLTKIPSSEKNANAPLGGSKSGPTSHQTKFTLKIGRLKSNLLTFLKWACIGDQCPLEAISTLNCLKTCRQILTDEWWRSSSLKGDCNISCSHTKSMLLLVEFFYQFMIMFDTKFIISNI